MATLKMFVGLGMTVVLLGIAGARLGFLDRIGACALPVEPGRAGKTGDIAEAPPRPVRPDLDDASSFGAATAPSSEQ